MTHPFEDEEKSYFVLMNEERQHSLWPEFSPVPLGWGIVLGPAARLQCLEFIETNWTDMRPKRLQDAHQLLDAGEAGE